PSESYSVVIAALLTPLPECVPQAGIHRKIAPEPEIILAIAAIVVDVEVVGRCDRDVPAGREPEQQAGNCVTGICARGVRVGSLGETRSERKEPARLPPGEEPHSDDAEIAPKLHSVAPDQFRE